MYFGRQCVLCFLSLKSIALIHGRPNETSLLTAKNLPCLRALSRMGLVLNEGDTASYRGSYARGGFAGQEKKKHYKNII